MLFKEEIDQNATGMNLESLKKSRKIRDGLISKYGYLPESILKRDREDIAFDLSLIKRDYRKKIERKLIKEKGMRKAEAKIFETQKAPSVLSKFPQNVGRIIVEFYCLKTESSMILLRGTTAECNWSMNASGITLALISPMNLWKVTER